MEIDFPDIATLEDIGDLIFVGGDLTATNLVKAYKAGYFPMPFEDEIGWFSPAIRAAMKPSDFNPSRSLRQSAKKFTTSINTCFSDVVAACADSSRPHGWISKEISEAYAELHHLGIAHSIEVWNHDKTLVGGLYGVHIDSLFAGESMFHSETDASKVALLALTELLNCSPDTYIDAQWQTSHLESLGFCEMHRNDYGKLLKSLVT